MNNEIIKTVNELVKILDQCLLGDEITLSINRMKQLLDYITNLQEKYDKALEDSVKETHKLMAIRKYLKDNEREYGSLEDNEKIILGIIEGE